MKKLFPLFVILLVFAGCTTDVKTNTPGFQAYRDDVLWRGVDVKAYVASDGHLRIVALIQNEELEINTYSDDVGAYYFGSNYSENTADFTSTHDDVYLRYSTYDAGGPILNINNPLLTGGTGYTGGNFNPTTTTGTGYGLRVNTTVNSDGVVTAVRINSNTPAIGYKPGDVITITGGNNNAKFKISSEIVITENDGSSISGTFRFSAKNLFFNPAGSELVSFQYGAFYKVPLIPEP